MKTPIAAFLAALSLTAAAVCLGADSPHMGTWKLNEAKSKIPAGAGKNMTVVYTSEGDQIKVTTEGVGADGTATHGEWVGRFDDKPYPVKGNQPYDSMTYKMVSKRTNEITGMKDGKTIFTGRITVAADGKSRTVTVHLMKDGKKVTEKEYYDKE